MIRDFDELLADTRAELDKLRSSDVPGPQPGTGRGSALDGRIQAEMNVEGRVTALTLDPAVMRMDERILAREIITAINTAWAARQGVDEAAAAGAAIDPAALQERLTEVQDRSLASMRRFTESMRDLVTRIERSTSR